MEDEETCSISVAEFVDKCSITGNEECYCEFCNCALSDKAPRDYISDEELSDIELDEESFFIEDSYEYPDDFIYNLSDEEESVRPTIQTECH